MEKPLRILFFGTPEPAREILEKLIGSHHEIVGVITRPDKRRGRGKTLVPTPVKAVAVESEIPFYEPNSKAELEATVKAVKADVGVVVAYGRILPKSVIEHFSNGCINVHYSVLPRWRGAAPVERAILEGDETSGVSIMQMDEGLDTGAVYAYRRVDILPSTTSETLFRSMNAVAGDLLVVVLDHLSTQEPIPQSGEPTYAHKLDSNDFFFDSKSSIAEVDRKVRAASLVKGAWTFVGEEKFRVLQVGKLNPSMVSTDKVGFIERTGVLSCVDGTIELNRVQMPGKPVLDFNSWANGVAREKFPLRLDS